MKKALFCFLLFAAPLLSHAQPAGSIEIDTVNFILPNTKEIILQPWITAKLEPFNDKDDAIVYIYRLNSIFGCAVRWLVQAGDVKDHLWMKEYVVVHLDTKKKNHWIAHKYFNINYVDFKPNTYYYYRLKGVTFTRGYMDEKQIKEISTCKRTKNNQPK